MEHEQLTPILPDGVEPAEADALESTWRMLGSIDAPAPDPERMRARLDALVDTFEDASRHQRIIPFRRRVMTHALQGLAAAAVLLIGIAIGRFGVRGGIGLPGKGRPAQDSEIAAMRSKVHDLREMVSLSLMQQQS